LITEVYFQFGTVYSEHSKHFPKEEIFYGIDTHMRIEEHNELKNLIKIPFQI
ncbi:MAG: hypothetical protein ACI9Q9_001432, partial [Flavobacterium sp.]